MSAIDKEKPGTDPNRQTDESREQSQNVNDTAAQSGSDAATGRIHTDQTETSEDPSTAEESSYHKTGESSSGVTEENKDQEQIELEQKISRLEEELNQTRESMLRKAAEFENLKRRTQKEKTHVYEDARIDAVTRFLPVREDLKRSIEASKEQDVDQGFLEGLRLVLDNFDRILDDYGVEPIEETGVPFNVDMHDAMLTQPPEDESVASNTVIQVLEPGYKIGDRVIKHARVIVSQ